MHDTDELISAYIDGALDPKTARKVECLIAADPAVRLREETFRKVSFLLRIACKGQAHVALGRDLRAETPHRD
jgi:anti-sigma factor RsiW